MANINVTLPDGTKCNPYIRRNGELYHDRPIFDMKGSIHHSLCYIPFSKFPGWGFWAEANLHTRDADGEATGVCFEMPIDPPDDPERPAELPRTATRSFEPPMGGWCRGRPWAHDPTGEKWVETQRLEWADP